MEKYNNLKDYFDAQHLSKEDLKEMMLKSSLNLLADCAHNFGENPHITEETAQPLFFLNEILDSVE